MKNLRFFFIILLICKCGFAFAAKVDTISIAGSTMNKTYKAAVVLPDSYKKNKSAYPVMYLLHGAFGHFGDWLKNPKDKTLVTGLADKYNLIVVLPEGETFSVYLNSPIDKQSQFETYIINDVIKKIDAAYRTVHDKSGRVITGLSMGGHGAFYLSTRHPDLFCAAGSMSGGLDVDVSHWKLDPKSMTMFGNLFKKILGSDSTTYGQYSVVNMADKMKTNGVKLTFDCGVDDFLLGPNRELHQRLVYNHTPHDYTERPGAHTWDYWQNSLPYHVLFFYNILKQNGVTVQ
jgi:putative tributyrin esterase